MITRTNRLVFINVIVSILFVIPAFRLDLFNENYSTLSLTTRGYLYVLFEGIFIGLLLAKETYIITKNKICSIFIFLSLLIGTIIPHHIPYNLQGNLHLLFAYIGFAGLTILTINNIKYSKYLKYYMICLLSSVLIYLKCEMVNTLSEVIVMLSTLAINLLICIKKEDR